MEASTGARNRIEWAADERLLNIQDVAGLFNVAPSWVRRRLRRHRAVNRIPAFKLGKYWRFRREEVLDWLETQKT